MNASATSDFSPPDSSDRRLVVLPAGVTSISIPGVVVIEGALPSAGSRRPGLRRARLAAARSPRSAPNAGSRVGPAPRRRRGPARGRGALTRRSRPEPPGNRRSMTSSKLRAAASNVSSKLSRMRRSVSRIRPPQLGQRGLEVLALRLELLDVRERLLVLALGQRVDRAEALAAALEPLEPRLRARRAPPSSSGSRLPPTSSSSAEPLGDLGQLGGDAPARGRAPAPPAPLPG